MSRSRVINIRRMTQRKIQLDRLLNPVEKYWRPTKRADCIGGSRPCPFALCEFHLFLDVNLKNGSIKLNFPDLEVWELEETCLLDVIDRGVLTLSQAGQIMNLTNERVSQLEISAIEKVKRSKLAAQLLRDIE